MHISDLILLNDHQVIALNKPSGMPAQDDKSGDTSLHTLAQAYCKRDLYVVHRIDRPCSGIVLYAKNKTSAAAISAQFADGTLSKEYLAVVNKGITPRQGTLKNDLLKVMSGKVKIVEGDAQAKEVELEYEWIADIDNYDLLNVIPHSGRLHQIRAQLGAAGYPIKGDVKYGARRGNRDRSIHLHAHKLKFKHPSKAEVVNLEAPRPDEVVWQAFQLP